MSKEHDDLRALAEKATPGPWGSRPDREEAEVFPSYDGPPEFGEWAAIFTARDTYEDDNLDRAHANAAYIACVDPNSVIALLDEIERLREALIWYSDTVRVASTATQSGEAAYDVLMMDEGKRADAALTGGQDHE